MSRRFFTRRARDAPNSKFTHYNPLLGLREISDVDRHHPPNRRQDDS